jgi:hypothetical protein
VIGDVNTQDSYLKITSICEGFNLIIDDGSHRSLDVINSFINYFPLLKPGGVFVIEDTHCLYQKNFGGGVLNAHSAISFFKKLVDITNFQWWERDLSMETYFQDTFNQSGIPDFITNGWIDEVSFRNSIVTVKKSSQPGHDKLGARIISGADSLVQNWGGRRPT